MSNLKNKVVVHPHPIVEMRLDGELITIINTELDQIESDFYLNEQTALEIIELMKVYLNSLEQSK